MKTKVMQVGILASILIVGSGASGYADSQRAGTQLSENDALALVRAVNTVEATIFMKNHEYVPLKEVLEHPSFRPKQNVSRTDGTSARVQDYAVSVVASADGKHYGVELTPTDPHPGCRRAFFSNEAAIIYIAKPTGCYPTE